MAGGGVLSALMTLFSLLLIVAGFGASVGALQLPKGQEMTPGPIRLERQIKRRQGKSDASGTREEP